MDDVYISRTGVNKLTIRKGKKLPPPDENVGGNPLPQSKSNERSSVNVSATTGVGSTYHVFNGVHSWMRDPSPTGESSSSSSVGGLSIGGTLLKCSISEMSPSSLVLPSPKDSGVDVNSPCHRGDEEGVMSLGGVAHVGECDVGGAPNGADVGTDRGRRTFVTADPCHSGSVPRNSSSESSRAVTVKESRSKSIKLDPRRQQSSSNGLQTDHLSCTLQRTQSPLIIKRHRDTTRTGFNVNSDEGKSFNSKSASVSTDASSRDIYSFGAADSISPDAKVTKARRVQRPTNLTNLPKNFNDEVPADSEPPTPAARLGFRFFSGDRRRSNVADNAAARLLREFTGVNNGEKKSVDKKMVSSDKRNHATTVVAPTATTAVDAKECARKYTLVPVQKPDANKLIIKFSSAGLRAMGTAAASSQGTPVSMSLTDKVEPSLLTIKKARSTKLYQTKGSLLAVASKNNFKGKSRGLAASRGIDRLTSRTDKSSVMGSQAVAVRDPLLEATYRPRPSRGTTSAVKDPVVLGSTILSTDARQSQPVADTPSAAAAKKTDCGNMEINPKTAGVEAPAISSKSKQLYSAVKLRLPAEKILSENSGNISVKCKVDDTKKTSFVISLKTTTASAKLTEETGAPIVIAQAVVEKTNSDVKNIEEAVDETVTPKNTAVCPNLTDRAQSVARIVSEETAIAETKSESNVGNIIIPSSHDSIVTIKVDELKVNDDELKVKGDELKIPPLTINKISLSIKRGTAGSWYVPESSKERRRERKLKKHREKRLSDHHPDDSRDDSSHRPLNDAATTEQHQHDPLSLECNVVPERLTIAEVEAPINLNANFVKRESPNSSILALQEIATGDYNPSAALPVNLDNFGESRNSDNVSESRQSEVQSIVSKEESVIRPEHHVRSTSDLCVTSIVPDIVDDLLTSIKLVTHKKSKKHGKKNRGEALPSIENLAENVSKFTTSDTAEREVVPEKKINVKLTRPWEDGIPSDTTVKLTTSTSALSEFKGVSLESRISLNNEHKSAPSAFSRGEESFRLSYSNSKDNQMHPTTRVLETANFNFSDECKKTTDPFSFVPSPKTDVDHVDSVGFVGKSPNLNHAVVGTIAESTVQVKTLKTSASAVNGKRKSSNEVINGVVAKRSKVVATETIPCSSTQRIMPAVTCSSANKVNHNNSHKLNGIVARLSTLNECSTTLARERKSNADARVTLSFVNADQTGENVEQILKRKVTDLVDTQVNPVTKNSKCLTRDEVSHESVDKQQQRETSRSLSNETFTDDSASTNLNCDESDQTERETVVKFQSTEKVKSCIVSDGRTTCLSEKEVVSTETGRSICPPSQNETIVENRTTLSENVVLSAEICRPISSPLQNVSAASHDCSEFRQESTTTSPFVPDEKLIRPIKRDKSTVKRKYIKEKVQPCELPLPTKPLAISTSRKSTASCNSRPVELPVSADRVTPELSESSKGFNSEVKSFPEVQLNQHLSISAAGVSDNRVEAESICLKKGKDAESDKAPIAHGLGVSTTQSNDRDDAISCFGRTSGDTTSTVDSSYPKNLWKNSPYSFCLNDDSEDNDADDSSPCQINTPSPSSSPPRSVAKDIFASDKRDCPSSFDSLYDDRNSTNFEVPSYKITGETYPSKTTTTKTKKQKVTRVSAVPVTDVLARNDNTQIISNYGSKVSNCFQPDVSLSSVSDYCGTMTSLEALTPPPSACEVASDQLDNCSVAPSTIFKDGHFSREDETFQSDELRTSSGAVLDIDAVSEFLNVDQYSVNASSSSQDPIAGTVYVPYEKNAKEEERQKHEQQVQESSSFSSDLTAVDTAYMDIISSLSLDDATPFSDLSGASRREVGKTDQGQTKQGRELSDSPSRSVEKLSICRPWSDSDKAAVVKDIEELEQQSRLFDNANNSENKSDTTANNSNAGVGEYDPLDIDSIIRSICSGPTTNQVDPTFVSDSNASNRGGDKVTERTCILASSDLAALEPMLEPLVLSSFDPSTLCGLDDDSSATSGAVTNVEMNAARSLASDCHDVTTKDSICSTVNDVKEPQSKIFVGESKDEHKEVEGKAVPCVGYLGAFAKFLQCSDPLGFDHPSSSSVDADEVKEETCDATILGADNAARSKQPICRSAKKNKNRNLIENNYCASPLSTDLEESRLLTSAAGGNNQVTRRNSRIFRRSTLLKQMCRFRHDGGSYEDDGTGTDSDQTTTSSRSNRSFNAGGTRDKSRKSSSKVAGRHLEQINEEATLNLIKYDDIRSVARTSSEIGVVGKETSVVVANAVVAPVKDSFVSVQLELAELESSVRLLFDVMFSGGVGGMGGFSIIPKIFSASVTESASSSVVEQLLDAICTILAGDDSNENNSDKNSPADRNRQTTHSDGSVIMLCNQPQSCLARLKRKIATVLTLVLPDLAIDAEEIYREENVGELLRKVISANTVVDSSRAVHGSSLLSSSVEGSDKSSSQLSTSKSSNAGLPQSNVPERLDGKRKLNGAGDFDSRGGLGGVRKSIHSGCVDLTGDESVSNKSRIKRVNKTETRKGRSLPSRSSQSRVQPTEQDRTNGT